MKIEPLEYCPVNEIKNEVLSQLFDCEPHLLLQPGQEGDLGPPAETGAGIGAGEAGESLRMKKQELQVNHLNYCKVNVVQT